MDENNNWPIHPKWLSIEKGILESEVKPNSQGIFKSDTLRGFIADASADKDIDNTLSIFQVVKKDYNYDDNERIKKISTQDEYLNKILEDREIIRIDPGKLYGNIKCCEAFRKCKDKNGNSCEDKCHDLDCRISLLYHPLLSNIHFIDEYDNYIKILGKIINEYNQSLKKTQNEHEDYLVKDPVPFELTIGPKIHRSVYLKYRCKFSDLDEYFYPVIHSGKIIAVIMQGQCPYPGLKRDNMFKEYRDDSLEGKALDLSIKKDLEDAFFHDASLNEDHKNAIYKRINALEVRIDDAIKSIAQQYVSEKFGKTEEQYREKLQNKYQNKYQNKNIFSEDFTPILNNALSDIFESFNKSGFIRIYTRNSDLEMIDSGHIEFSLIGEAVIQNSSVNISSIPKLRFRQDLPQKDTSELKKYLLDEVSLDDNDIFRLKTQFGTKVGYIIWKRYDQWKKDYPKQYKLYADSLIANYSSLLEPYFILRSLVLEENLERTMRISVHESAQVIPSVIESINTEETKANAKGESFVKHTYNVPIPSYKIIDSTQRLMLLERLFGNSTMIFKKDSVKPEKHDIFRIIYATDSLFSRKAKEEKDQCLKIDFEHKLKSFELMTDYGYMSHILFNLVDNAIKYGFRGSNIIVKVTSIENTWIVKDNKIDALQISIISFGPEIKEKDRSKIFDLYYRPQEVKKKVEGMGLGLFLAQKLCHAMGYQIQCKPSKKVSDINLPYFFHFKRNNSNYKEKGLCEKVLKQLNFFVNEFQIEETINKKIEKWRIPVIELEENLGIPTYKNVFEIKIPVNTEILKKSE